ncbi:MAG: hypothetical protein AAGA22_02935 [Pseudomonadota bacterium]
MRTGCIEEFSPSRRNDGYANSGLLETEVNEAPDPLTDGNCLPRAPAFSLKAGFEYAPIDNLEFGADVRFSDTYFSDTQITARAKINPYTIINARIACTPSPATLFVTARNLFDAADPVSIFRGAIEAFEGAILMNREK